MKVLLARSGAHVYKEKVYIRDFGCHLFLMAVGIILMHLKYTSEREGFAISLGPQVLYIPKRYIVCLIKYEPQLSVS